MDEKLYKMMDWAGVEAIVYSEEDHPHDLLGPHLTEEGVMIQAFIPGAKEVSVKIKGGKKTYPMDLEDEAGFFSALIPGKRIPSYTYVVTFENGGRAGICRSLQLCSADHREGHEKIQCGDLL